MNDLWPWLVLCVLGAFHGLNPAMGWLFAVSLGLQEQRSSAVWRALPPIALGHAISVGIFIGAVAFGRVSLPPAVLKYTAALALVGFGAFRLVRQRHPRWVGMRVSFRDLTWWSFLMASAHGAGLMLLPLYLSRSVGTGPMLASRASMPLSLDPLCGTALAPFNSAETLFASVLLHTGGQLVTAGLIAWVIFQKVGLAILRSAWINLDLLWSVALMLTGAVTLFF